MKKSLMLATSAIIASGLAVPHAQAIDVDLYGQVNKAVIGANVANDGSSGDINIVDNDISSTRFGLRGNQQLDNGLTASVLIEGQMQGANGASNTRNLDNGAAGTNADSAAAAWSTRHARVGLGGQWGALFVGKTSVASDGIAEIDLGPAQDVTTSAISRIGGAIQVGPGNVTIGELSDNVDGHGFGTNQHGADRANLVRFDTPAFRGLSARASYTQNQDVDAVVLYNNSFNTFEVAGGASYVKYDRDTGSLTGVSSSAVADSAYSVTASVKHNSGLSATANYGERNLDGLDAVEDDPTAFYVKLGYHYNNTGFAVNYAQNDDALLATDNTTYDSSELNAYGAYIQQDLGHGVSTSAFYKQLQSEIDGADNPDVDLFGVNMRVKF